MTRGHEFHFSSIESVNGIYEPLWEASNSRGEFIENAGFKVGNVLASYIHLHFASNPKITKSIVEYLLK